MINELLGAFWSATPDGKLFFLIAAVIWAIGLVGPFWVFKHMLDDEAEDAARHSFRAAVRRLAAGAIVALCLSVGLHAARPAPVTQDVVVEHPCSEEVLRRECGEWWEYCWWSKGCFLIPA